MTFLFCVQEDQKNSLCTCTLVNLSFRIFSKKIGNRFLQFIRHFLKRILVESLFAVFSVVVVVILCTCSLVNLSFRIFFSKKVGNRFLQFINLLKRILVESLFAVFSVVVNVLIPHSSLTSLMKQLSLSLCIQELRIQRIGNC